MKLVNTSHSDCGRTHEGSHLHKKKYAVHSRGVQEKTANNSIQSALKSNFVSKSLYFFYKSHNLLFNRRVKANQFTKYFHHFRFFAHFCLFRRFFILNFGNFLTNCCELPFKCLMMLTNPNEKCEICTGQQHIRYTDNATE